MRCFTGLFSLVVFLVLNKNLIKYSGVILPLQTFAISILYFVP